MNIRKLAKIDLNLLISLQVLLETKNVSRAAEQLYITQPAMSKTLSRLRRLFDDPLFTRSSHGMQPTPKALELTEDLGQILRGITQLVTDSSFDPGTFTGEITMALSEYIGVALLPQLARRLQTQAPLLRIRAITRVENQLEELALGNLDFAVHLQQASYGTEYRVQELGGSPPALLMRDNHPLTRDKISWQRLSQYPLIRLYVSDWEQLEIQRNSDAMSRMFEHLQGSLEISHLLTALEVLRHTDYFMPAPSYILQNEDVTRGITALPVPREGDYSLNYALVAHNRTANSPMHNWLWEQITCTIADLRTPQLRKIRHRVAAGSNDLNQ